MNSLGVLAIIQAGGAGGRMDVLTVERAKPTLPFAGSYRLIDFSLSNLMHSRVDDVWLSVQYQAATLEQAVRGGRPWDLDRTWSGLRLVSAQEGGTTHEEGMNAGNADELYALRDRVRASGCRTVLVMSADHAYQFDYRDLLATHDDKGAEATVLWTDIEGLTGADAADHAVVEVNRLSRVTAFDYKPDNPSSTAVAAEVIAYDAAVLVEVLEELHRELTTVTDRTDADSGLGDFGELLMPRLVERGSVYGHRLDGYWRDLGQPHHYLNAHLELVAGQTDLFDPRWPIRGHQVQTLPARVSSAATVAESLLSPGSVVEGEVRRSVIGPGVHVAPGAVVEESVLFEDVRVGPGCRVHRSIVDAGAELTEGAVVGHPHADLTDPDAVTIVGRDSAVAADLDSGARLFPGSQA